MSGTRKDPRPPGKPLSEEYGTMYEVTQKDPPHQRRWKRNKSTDGLLIYESRYISLQFIILFASIPACMIDLGKPRWLRNCRTKIKKNVVSDVARFSCEIHNDVKDMENEYLSKTFHPFHSTLCAQLMVVNIFGTLSANTNAFDDGRDHLPIPSHEGV
ncbi:uncharacterized protein EAF01_010495 [Botrytis porri]|uniref:Uncharacterized protein n=1 Tax=Botrytis porri TaxID=87229 RepID=A0A4Z1KI14_9HELO|nr:uncharacterized protein EAF01_010495 [Botrytis porri]KAF7892415.1 hypothetical protein EAF01_010495 [Botrytis porri]TGO83204.1 hypothetical protein BPOR_0685g00030 [Botrytis porri]